MTTPTPTSFIRSTDFHDLVVVDHDGREYTAYFDADDERVAVVYAVDGVWAGQGRWIADSGETVDCGAVIPDVVYAALDVGLRAQLAAQ